MAKPPPKKTPPKTKPVKPPVVKHPPPKPPHPPTKPKAPPTRTPPHPPASRPHIDTVPRSKPLPKSKRAPAIPKPAKHNPGATRTGINSKYRPASKNLFAAFGGGGSGIADFLGGGVADPEPIDGPDLPEQSGGGLPLKNHTLLYGGVAAALLLMVLVLKKKAK